MSEFILSMAIVALVAQAPAPMSDPPTEETVRMVAVRASTQGRAAKDIPEELKDFRGVLELLPFDTYQPIADHEEIAPYGKETEIPIDDVYTFYFLPIGPAEEPGKIDFAARAEMRTGQKTINALMASGEAAYEKTLIFQGLPSEEGEVLVLFNLVQPDQGDEDQSQGDQEQQQEPQEQQQEQQQPEPSEDRQEQDGQQEPQDLQNIEAILQSLEEIDRREQEESKERPAGMLVPRAGWW